MASGDGIPHFASTGHSRSLHVGQTLANRYRILCLLGHGGMGEVYEAEDTVLGMSVALKTIRGEADQTSVRRFQRELVLARAVSHSNVCRVYDFGSDDVAGAFYTMELLRGDTLATVLKQRGPFSVKEARTVAVRVAQALEAAHAHGIVHRDLKPGNIFITEDGRVVVTDFGLARASGDSMAARAAADTATNWVAGTPAYMAPEQLSGAEPTASVDLYALGVVMYEMTVGHLPWVDHGSARFTATPKPPGIEPQWDGVVLRCLSVVPEKRFAAAAEVRTALTGESSSRFPWLPWAVAATVGMIAVTAFLMTYRRAWTPRPEAVSWYERGLSALHDGDFNSAARQLQMAVEADPKFAMGHARLAEAWAEQDYSDRARQAMLQASTVAANHPIADRTDELRLLAIQMMVARDFPGSVERYGQIAGTQRNADTLFDLARAMERNSESARAIDKLREAIALKDSYPAAWATLGALLGRKGDFSGAHEAYRKAESLYNIAGNLAGVAEVWLRKATTLRLQGQVEEASTVLDQALHLAETTGFESQRIRIQLRRGAMARLREQSEAAEGYVGEALRLAEENRMEQYTIDGLIDLGNVYLQKLDLASAEKHYGNALRFGRSVNSRYHEARAMASIASVRSQQGRLEDARAGAEKALAFYRQSGYQNESLSLLSLLAQVRGLSGDAVGALAAFEEQLNLTNPKNERAVAALHLRIGIALLSLERFSESMPHLEVALKAPDSSTRAYAALNKADILATTGDGASARSILTNAALLNEPSGLVSKRASVLRTAVALNEGRYPEAVREAEDGARRMGQSEPAALLRLKAYEALALAQSGNGRRASTLCAEILKGGVDAKATAVAALYCAEAELAAGHVATAKSNATRARAALAKLGQPEAEWRACTVEAFSSSREEAGARVIECDNIRKLAAERWGKDLWERYMARADVRARIARLQKITPARPD
ncbi:MAG: protein kinase [Bryobacteraceae bacterium]|nr:protein kinase [Bryobacteraceae bacterium]